MPARADTPAGSLAELVKGIVQAPVRDLRVTDVTLDSRAVTPGALFLACRGRARHGLEFLDAAIAQGATAVLWESGPTVAAPRIPAGVTAFAVNELSRHVGVIADRFFGSPSAALSVCGITGTNGKTTTAFLLAQTLETCGEPSAYAGTLGFGRVRALRGATHTTPDCVSVHRQLADARGLGVRNVAMEVSSHALDQGRVQAVRFRTAIFTNLTRDHLDYHRTMEAYGAAKARLFATPDLEHRVINVGDAFGRELAARTADHGNLITAATEATGPRAERYVIARHVRTMPRGLDLDVETHLGAINFNAPLVGRFNAENVLLTLAALLARGIALDKAARALANVCAPAGRMETFHRQGRAVAVVDYAHSPDALAKALAALREHCAGQLWCVFGCGGDRDPGKRPLMAAVVERLADVALVTDDNPRGEDGDAIVADILRGFTRRSAVRVIRDRAQAIETAMSAAQAGDVVLIAGKGHEDYQIYGTEQRAFSDRAVVLGALEES
jgi:UDP-N-acetylmuramoyl-L-alanyl-D-glutamate--2,6-diaminopimelate ligase